MARTLRTILTAGNHDWRDAVRDRLGAIEQQQDRLAEAKAPLSTY
ncbi:hypothetical protein [Mycolicibacterium lutetiense]